MKRKIIAIGIVSLFLLLGIHTVSAVEQSKNKVEEPVDFYGYVTVHVQDTQGQPLKGVDVAIRRYFNIIIPFFLMWTIHRNIVGGETNDAGDTQEFRLRPYVIFRPYEVFATGLPVYNWDFITIVLKPGEHRVINVVLEKI